MGNLSPLKIIYLKLHFGNGKHLIVAVFIVFLLFGLVVGAIRLLIAIAHTEKRIDAHSAIMCRTPPVFIVLALARGLIIFHLSLFSG